MSVPWNGTDTTEMYAHPCSNEHESSSKRQKRQSMDRVLPLHQDWQ